jgi:hypothetical protein
LKWTKKKNKNKNGKQFMKKMQKKRFSKFSNKKEIKKCLLCSIKENGIEILNSGSNKNSLKKEEPLK